MHYCLVFLGDDTCCREDKGRAVRVAPLRQLRETPPKTSRRCRHGLRRKKQTKKHFPQGGTVRTTRQHLQPQQHPAVPRAPLPAGPFPRFLQAARRPIGTTVAYCGAMIFL